MGGYDLGAGLIDTFVKQHGGSGGFNSLEDFSDRLSHFYSCVIIFVLSGVTMANVYFLRPISCTLPTNPSTNFVGFAESMCWVQGTIRLNSDEEMPTTKEDWEAFKDHADISFYQWVPFCLSIQALLFYLPHLIWQSGSMYSFGDNLEFLLAKTRQATNADDLSSRGRCVDAAAYHLFRLARQHQDTRTGPWATFQHKLSKIPGGDLLAAGKRMGNWISILYLFIKLLYICNAVGQLYIIRTFLGGHAELYTFGRDLVLSLVNRREWGGSDFFPHQTYCPISVRHLGARNNVFTAICALPVNMFNEKIYIFLWIWIALVLAVSAFSLLLWAFRLLMRQHSRLFLGDFLILSIASPVSCPQAGEELPQPPPRSDAQLQRFLRDVVRCDGNFMIRMLRANAGDVITGEVLVKWWTLYKRLDDYEKGTLLRKKGQLMDDLTSSYPTAFIGTAPDYFNVPHHSGDGEKSYV